MKKIERFENSDIGKILSEYVYGREKISVENLFGSIDKNEYILIDNIITSKKILHRDSPDGFILNDNKTIIIECFKIDYSELSKGTYINQITKGNPTSFDREKMIMEILQKEQYIDKFLTKITKNVSKIASYKHFETNFLKGYIEHFDKIETYKNNLIESVHNISTNFEVAFFIQDVTPFDKLMYSNTDIEPEEDILLTNKINIIACINQVADKVVDHIFVFTRILNKPRIIYANKRMITGLKEHIEKHKLPSH